MEKGPAAAILAGAVLLVLGVAAVALAIHTYGFYHNCGLPVGSRVNCPGSLGSSDGFLAGLAALVAGVLITLYGWSMTD